MYKNSVGIVVENILLEFLTGIGLAVGAGIASKIIVYIPDRTSRIYFKMFYCIGAAIMFVMLSY
jgi:cysteine synthase